MISAVNGGTARPDDLFPNLKPESPDDEPDREEAGKRAYVAMSAWFGDRVKRG